MSPTTEARIPRILEQAPDSRARSTHGVIQLSDYTAQGKYVLLFSRSYGLVREAASDAATVRAVFAIDPKRNIRAIVYYPMQLGRNVDELIRIFEGLQTIDGNGVSVPAHWKVGEPVDCAGAGCGRRRAQAHQWRRRGAAGRDVVPLTQRPCQTS
jgi:alkyl hydroperoxide reductase subunit AhpC